MAAKKVKEIVKLKKLHATVKEMEASIAQLIEDLGSEVAPDSASVESESKEIAAIRKIIAKCKPELHVRLLETIKAKMSEYRTLGLLDEEQKKPKKAGSGSSTTPKEDSKL